MTFWCTLSILHLKVLVKANKELKIKRILMVRVSSSSKSSITIMLKDFRDLKVLLEAPIRLNSNLRVPNNVRRRDLRVLSQVHQKRV